MSVSSTINITFGLRELPEKLVSASGEVSTGYWQLKFTTPLAAGDSSVTWFLAMSQGRVIFSGTQPLSWKTLCQTLQRYLPSLRTATAKQTLQAIEQESSQQDLKMLSKLLLKAEKALSLERQSVVSAIHLQILSDFDTYLFEAAGVGQYSINNALVFQAPVSGFKLEDLMFQSQMRQTEWKSLRRYIPTMQALPTLNSAAMSSSGLSEEQLQLIQKLISLGKPLNAIAQITAKDPLETAKMFAKLVERGLVSLELPPEAIAPSTIPEVFIVDDSPIFLQKFQALVTKWGYRVNVCANPSLVIQKMLEANPAIVFVDINMPGMSGFDLIKEVRRQPQLSGLSLVLLTAENSLSNQWRAKWGNCKFLAKPRSPEEIASFQEELRQLLQEVIPLPQSSDKL
jgi:CheY-like chemotaxis protein